MMSVHAIEQRSKGLHPNETLEQIYGRYTDWGEVFVSSEESGKIDGVQGEIYRDVGRTMPTNSLFSSGVGQPVLGRILKAVAFCHNDVGYCQGMNFVAAGILLTVLEEEGGLSKITKSSADDADDADDADAAMRAVETKTFFLMCGVLQSCGMEELWRKGLPRVQLRVYQFERVMQQHLPRLHGHFHTIGLTLDFFVSQWFLTLFAYSLPIGIILPVPYMMSHTTLYSTILTTTRIALDMGFILRAWLGSAVPGRACCDGGDARSAAASGDGGGEYDHALYTQYAHHFLTIRIISLGEYVYAQD
jgi:hypothetical protein